MLTRWDPFTDFFRFDFPLTTNAPRVTTPRRAAFEPLVDVHEDESQIQVRAELPGLRAEDVDVSVHEGLLTLKGERRLEREDRKDGYRRVERSYGAFSRSFYLPDTIDAEAIAAELKDGILTVTLPKRTKPEPRKIAVQSRAPEDTKDAHAPATTD